MNAASYIRPLRLEIRDKTATNDAPWSVFDLADTQAQAEDKLVRARVSAQCEARILPNAELAAELEPIVQDTPGTLQLLEQIQTENMALRRDLNSTRAELANFRKEKAAAAAPLDALAGETPLPFGVGDVMRDIYTGVAVRVTELNPKSKMGNPRPGFAWVNLTTKEGDKDHTGWCPLASVGCFVKIKEGDPVKIAPGENPEPTLPPEAEAATAPEAAHAAAAPIVPPVPVPHVPVNRRPARATHRSATPPAHHKPHKPAAKK